MQGWQGPGPLPPRSPMCVCRNVCGFYIKFWCLLCTRVCCCGWRGRGPCPEPCPDPHRFPSGTRLWHRDVVLGQGPGAQHSPRAWEAASSAPSRRAGAGSPPPTSTASLPAGPARPASCPACSGTSEKPPEASAVAVPADAAPGAAGRGWQIPSALRGTELEGPAPRGARSWDVRNGCEPGPGSSSTRRSAGGGREPRAPRTGPLQRLAAGQDEARWMNRHKAPALLAPKVAACPGFPFVPPA